MEIPRKPSRSRPRYSAALGRAIKLLRTEQGVERKELADRAGISYSYLAEIENGNKPPSSSVLVVLAEALGLRPHQIHAAADNLSERRDGQTTLLAAQKRTPDLDFSEPMSVMRAAPAGFDRPPDRQREIVELLDQLTDKDLELVLDLARRLRG
ncbi:MAG: helix-turn-helix domain-containing protein [Acidimicrobiia bacterium]|nr:helix-turn-helix domain-containing protein [Acidimicrobiia bacterium]